MRNIWFFFFLNGPHYQIRSNSEIKKERNKIDRYREKLKDRERERKKEFYTKRINSLNQLIN